MYGPTVVMTTRELSASSRSESWSPMSARSSGSSAWPSLARTTSSFAGLRPAIAQRNPGGAFWARYSAVSDPVNPVAPNSTMSYGRSGAMPARCQIAEMQQLRRHLNVSLTPRRIKITVEPPVPRSTRRERTRYDRVESADCVARGRRARRVFRVARVSRGDQSQDADRRQARVPSRAAGVGDGRPDARRLGGVVAVHRHARYLLPRLVLQDQPRAAAVRPRCGDGQARTCRARAAGA